MGERSIVVVAHPRRRAKFSRSSTALPSATKPPLSDFGSTHCAPAADADTISNPRAQRNAFILILDLLARRFNWILAGIYAAGILALAASLAIGRGGDIIVGDAAESFEYARILATQGRLPAEHIRFPAGVAMLGALGYLPAFAVGKMLGGAAVVLEGRAVWLQAAYCIPLLALSVAGFLANVGALRILGFSDRVAKPVVLFFIVTTNVGYYVFKEPAMTESATYATVSLFYFLLLRGFYPEATRSDTKWLAKTLTLGLVIGLAGAIRQQNILHALSLPLLLIAQRRMRAVDWAIVGMAAVGAVLIFSIPWIVWSAAGPAPFFSYTEGKFYWSQPKPWLVLFVPGYHGLLLFHPVLWLAVVGLIWLLRSRPALRPAVIVAVLVQLYLLSTWYWLSLGASVGHRGFMTVMPLLLMGMAAFVERVQHRDKALVAGMAAFALGNAVVIVMVLTHVLDPTGAGYPAHSGFR